MGIYPKLGGTTTLVDDILDFQTNKYVPYSDKPSGLGFYTGTTNPDGTTRLNLNGKLYSTGFYSFGGTSNAGVFNVTGTEDIVKFQKSSTDQVTIDTNGQLNTKAVSSYTTGNTITTQSTNGYAINAFVTGSGSPALLSQNGSVSNGSSLLQIQRVVSGSGNVTGDVISITDNPTTSGTISGKVFTAIIGTTERISMNPRVADGASAIGYLFSTSTNLANASSKVFQFDNQGSNLFYQVGSGRIYNENGGYQAGLGSTSYSDFTSTYYRNVVSSSVRMLLNPSVADGASAVAYMFDTHNALSTTGAKIASFRIQGTESSYISNFGDYITTGQVKSYSGTTQTLITQSYIETKISGTRRYLMNPNETDGASAVAYLFDTQSTLTIEGAKLASFKIAGTEKTFVDKDGNIEITANSGSVILKSPNGTRYKITIADGGTISVTTA